MISTLAAIFLTEFAPPAVQRVLEPVIRLLAGVPSVIYGLIGILVLAPWINDHLISNPRKHSVIYVVQLNGADLMTATLILTVMILPIMVAITRQRARGRAALLARRLGRAGRQPLADDLARLAAHRAPGDRRRRWCSRPRERSARRSCSRWSPEAAPSRPTRSTASRSCSSPCSRSRRRSSRNSAGDTTGALAHTIYAIAAVLLFSAALLSLAGWAVKQPLKRYGIGV